MRAIASALKRSVSYSIGDALNLFNFKFQEQSASDFLGGYRIILIKLRASP
jgi:hypothetical protein